LLNSLYVRVSATVSAASSTGQGRHMTAQTSINRHQLADVMRTGSPTNDDNSYQQIESRRRQRLHWETTCRPGLRLGVSSLPWRILGVGRRRGGAARRSRLRTSLAHSCFHRFHLHEAPFVPLLQVFRREFVGSPLGGEWVPEKIKRRTARGHPRSNAPWSRES